MKRGSRFAWALFALLGLVLAAGVSIAASRLSSEHIGLSSEPITAGKRLVPSRSPVRRKRHRRKRTRPAVTTAPARPPATTVASPPPAPQVPATPAPPPKKTTTTPRRGDDHHPEREIERGDD
jgi:hypothetical protein